ncbi:hypothetical protein [Dictyobacter arantiisoli]|uniref:hypothetical protein n=1 Tax=Dictyobacter arantiisoli TaxID=2014874 RepID=UPI00155B03A2|nr:hypothetical protein [Dictyobacter arantiisoli]
MISVRQALTPARFLGRMTSIYRLLTYGVIPIAALRTTQRFSGTMDRPASHALD